MEIRPPRRFIATLTMGALVTVQLATGVFPIPISPTPKAYAAGFFIEKVRDDAPASQPVQPGGTIRYKITIRNDDTKPANARIIDPVPPELTFTSGSNGCAFVAQTQEVICAQQPLPIGSSRTVTLTFTVKNTVAACSVIRNQADVWNDDANYPTGIPPSWSDIIETPVNCPATFTLTKTGPATAQPGGTITYTLTARNTGNITQSNIRVADPVPAGLTFTTAGSTAGCSVSNGTVFCSSSSYAPNESKSFTLVFTVSATQACNSTINNTGDVQQNNASFAWSNQVSTQINCPAPNFTLVKSGPATVLRGGTITYTLTATNNGTITQSNIRIADPVPAGLTFTTAGSTAGCSVSNGTVFCTAASYSPGQSRSVTLVFTVPATHACNSTINNTGDIQQNNASFGWSNQVSTSVDCLSFTLTKTGPATAQPSGTITYTLTAKNNGATAQSNIRIADPVPAGLTFTTAGSTAGCSVSNGTVFCAASTFAPGESKSVTLVFTVSSTQACNSTVNNTGDIQQNNASFGWSNQVSTSVTCPGPNFTLVKSGPATVQPGGTITYTLTATNNGTITQSNIRVADPATAGLTFTTAGSTAGCALSNGTVFCPAETYTPGQSRSYTLVFTVSATQACNSTINNTGDVQQNNASFAWSNQVSTSVTCPGPNFTLVKSGPATVQPGGTITYTLTATNTGNINQSNIRVGDAIPAGLTFTTNGSTAGCTLTNNAVYCPAETYTPGQSRSYTLVFTVSATQACNSTINNSADIQQNNTSFGWSNTVVTSVTCPALRVMKTPSATTVTQGGTITYTLKVFNDGTVAANDVRIVDSIPAGLTFTTAGSSNNCALSNNTVVCGPVTVQPNGQFQMFTLVFTAAANATCNSTITNTAHATIANVQSGQSTNASVTVTCPTANLRVMKTPGSATVTQGGTITYTLKVFNDGTTPVSDVRVNDVVPAGLTFSPAGSSANCTLSNNTVICGPVTVQPNGQFEMFTVAFTVAANATCNSVISNTAEATVSNTPVAWSTQANVTVTCPTTNFTTTKTTNKTNAVIGENITYTIAIQNTGGTQLTNIWVIDRIPAGLTFNQAASDPRCFQQGLDVKCGETAINVGASDSYSIVMTVANTATCNAAIVNAADVLALNTQIIRTNQVSTFISCAGPNLRVMKTPGSATVTQGGTITYTLKVFNDGTTPVSDVRVNDVVPAGLTFSPAGSSANCTLSNNTVICGPVTVQPNGQFEMFTVAFTVAANATCNSVISNTAEATVSNTPVAWSTQANVTVTCPVVNADLEIYKTGPAQPMRGTTIVYAIAVENNGPSNAVNVRISDQVPSVLKQDNTGNVALVFNPAQSDALCSVSGNTVTCGNFNLNAGATRTFNVAFNLPFEAQCAKPVVNTATVTSDTNDNTVSNNSSTTAGSVNCATQTLDVVKGGPAVTRIGDLVTYSMAVTNNLSFNTTRNRLIDPVPDNLQFVSSTDTLCQYVAQTDEVICGEFDLAAGATRVFQMTFRVLNTARCNEYITNIADVWSNHPGVDPKWSNPVRTQVICTGSTFTVDKTDYLTNAAPGERLTYTITVRNTSANEATNVEIIDTLPANTTFIYASRNGQLIGNTVKWTVNIGAGDTEVFTVQVQVNANVAGGTVIRNEVCVNTTTCDDDTTTVVTQTPTFMVSKSDNRTVALKGDNLTYVVLVTNNSAFNATNVSVLDTLPSDVTFVSADNGGTYSATPHTVQWTIASLNAGTTKALTVVARIKDTATTGSALLNRVCVGTVCGEDTTIVNTSVPLFAISKTDNRTTALQGDVLNYIITVTNIGTATATNVQINDILPNDVTFLDAGNGGSYNQASHTVQWTVPTINAGQSITLSIQARVLPDTPNNRILYNWVQVAGGSSASDTTTVVATPPLTGCIDVKKETYNTNGNVLTPVSQFTFTLDNGTQTVLNDSNGNARFNNVPVGIHTVTEVIPTGWSQTSVTPTGGVITVAQGTVCSTVTFKNRQNNVGQAQFTITKTDNRTTANEGDTLSYVIVVTNIGSSNASNVQVTDPIPSRTTFVSASDGGSFNGGNVSWNFSLNAGASKTLTLQVRIDSNITSDVTVYNTATVTNGPSATDTTLVEGDDDGDDDGDIRITIDSDPNPYDICHDDEIEYEIRLTNDSNTNQKVDVTADLDDRTEYLTSSDGGRDRTDSVEWTNLTINKNNSRTLRLRVEVDPTLRDGDSVRLYVRLRSADNNNGSNSDNATEVTRIRGNCDTPPPPGSNDDITIDKTADYTEALPGTVVTYTVTIRNPGTTDIANATLEDRYPSQYLTIIDSGGASDAGGVLNWNLGTLRKNSTTVVRYRARLKEGLTLGTSILNTATVRGGTLTRTDTHTIVVPRPPQTGLGGFIHNIGKGDSYLSNSDNGTISAGTQAASLPLVVWMTTIITGLGAGMAFGRRFLF